MFVEVHCAVLCVVGYWVCRCCCCGFVGTCCVVLGLGVTCLGAYLCVLCRIGLWGANGVSHRIVVGQWQEVFKTSCSGREHFTNFTHFTVNGSSGQIFRICAHVVSLFYQDGLDRCVSFDLHGHQAVISRRHLELSPRKILHDVLRSLRHPLPVARTRQQKENYAINDYFSLIIQSMAGNVKCHITSLQCPFT